LPENAFSLLLLVFMKFEWFQSNMDANEEYGMNQ